ncbi:MAG: Ku protein [Burkholderiaceae bacterium]
MATTARSIASLTLSFGLVNVPVRLYSATESGSDIHFKLLDKDGSRVKQQYVNERTKKVVERKNMVKGYEIEQDHFVLFTMDELKQLEEDSSHVVDIVSFIPLASIDPIFYDRSYLLAPDKRGEKPYALLRAVMQKSDRCALAKWAWKAKQYLVQIRATDDGLILQQLRYGDEVRSLKDLDIDTAPVKAAELELALKLVDQITTDSFDPDAFEDEEKRRVLAAIDDKVKGKEIVASTHDEAVPAGGQVIDLMDALRSSLAKRSANANGKAAPAATRKGASTKSAAPARKGAKRASVKSKVAAPVKARAAARK